MVRRVGRTFLHALSIGCVVLAPPFTAVAHPIHMSFTEARYAAGTHTLQLLVRVFANDFAAAAARKSGIRLSADSVIDAVAATTYLAQNIQLVRADGHAANLVSCGVKRVNDTLLFCLVAAAPEGTQKMRMRNSVMTDLFGDQVNVVQTVDGDTRASRLFVRGDGLKALP